MNLQKFSCTAVVGGALLLLAACGGGGSASSTTAPTPVPTPVPTPTPTPTPAPTYSVGGSIAGLRNAVGLTLLNGSEALPVAANATAFTFSNKLTQNGSYSVSIGSQPTGATCSISNATGVVSSSDVQSVAVGCTPVLRSGPYTVSTVAGDDALTLVDGVGAAARFSSPSGFAKDGAGNMYLSDFYSHAIRKISPAGAVTTLAGNGTQGFADGAGANAQFYNPTGLAVDKAGNVYVADSGNNAVRKISPTGAVSTLANSFNFPRDVAVDSAGNVYVADQENQTIRKISPAGNVSTLAGNGTRGFVDGTGEDARFSCPNGLAMDGADNMYVADSCNSSIRKLTPSGVVTTVVGQPGSQGFVDGVGSVARFAGLQAVTLDNAGNLYVSDSNAVRKITPGLVVTTLAGGRSYDYADGSGASAQFNTPFGLVVDSAGTIYVADSGNHVVRKVSPAGQVTTWLGRVTGVGFVDATGTSARFKYSSGVATDGLGNVYVADSGNYAIRKIALSGAVTTLAGGSGKGTVDGTGSAARFQSPSRLAVDNAGNVYVMDGGLTRKVSPMGVVTTLGALGQISDQRGIAVDHLGALFVAAKDAVYRMAPDGAITKLAGGFGSLQGVAVDATGSVYAADLDKNTIFKISPQGQVSTLAGGTYGFVDGTGTAAQFSGPVGVAVDGAGNVYVAGDAVETYYSHVGFGSVSHFGGAVRKITSEGVVTTIAGNGRSGRADGPGASARFDGLTAIAVDAAGTVYVAEAKTNAIRKIAQ